MTLILIVDALEHAGVQKRAAVRQQPRQVGAQFSCEGPQRLDATAHRTTIPATPETRGIALVTISFLQLLQIVLGYVSDHQRTMGGNQLPQPHPVGLARDVSPVGQQQPAAAFDQAPCIAIGAQPIGLIDADPVDDLPTVLGHHVEEVIDDPDRPWIRK